MGTTKRTPGSLPIQRPKLREFEKVIAGISGRVHVVQRECDKLHDELQAVGDQLRALAEEKKKK